MYDEDKFHPTQENDYDKNKEINNIKSYDSGYGFVYLQKVLPNGKIKNVKVDCYASSDAGTYIRNAETGNFYKYKVGSKEENLFFKIAMSNGELKTKNGLNILFYDSPEQFENHLMKELSQDIKTCWLEKRSEFTSSQKSK